MIRESPYKSALLKLKKNTRTMDDVQRSFLHVWLNDYNRECKLSDVFLSEQFRAETAAKKALLEAKVHNNFSIYAGKLGKVIALKQREADLLGYKKQPYEAFLQSYEEDLTHDQIEKITLAIKDELIPLLSKYCGIRKEKEDCFIMKGCPSEKLISFACDLASAMGLNLSASRIDLSKYASCYWISPNDVRITIRNDGNFRQMISDILHETGHALYEQGFDEAYYCTPLAMAASNGVHEAAAIIWETFIGRSLSFSRYISKQLKKTFPSSFKGGDLPSFYEAMTMSHPSCHGSDSDELTRMLHLILRYELERDMISGKLHVKDLPSAWNEKMHEYFGVYPKSANDGVLQDWQWADGRFGYFPSCIMGSIYAAQIWSALNSKIPNIQNLVEEGDFSKVTNWLAKNIFRHGRLYPPQRLVKKISGSPVNFRYYTEYLSSTNLQGRCRASILQGGKT
jgi:carboxypeptidase Taq